MLRQETSAAILMQTHPDSAAAEAYRTLRINIDFAIAERGIKTIAVTSVQQDEGKTTTALNLAVAYARAGKKVLLVDADFRKPAVHRAFGNSNGFGLADGLIRQRPLDGLIQASGIDNLSIITTGPAPSSPSEMLASDKLDELLAELKRGYDMVLIDTPPSLGLIDAKIVASKCDGVLLVVEYRKVKRAAAKRVKDELTNVKAHVLGVVFNKINSKDAEAYYY
ncbi:CpsD/CapB family tyrosine-protein kinase [Paenibacillus piri]|uniref:non-specific protein-tyrosine kinase n=1 Tax=Paenibacillus piri TaxID=2547395 RepID=A0A4R5KWB1_9BACL|nr:CpsD/CapB family tyrosine-protein kinase [Paenibacillus piri]TDG00302.1 polysaccharide biosynthesis tyrosine autokinase [Paenibacillus piri]